MTLREKCRLRVFQNRVLRRVFGPKRDEVTEEWRKLHKEELRDLYSLPNIVRVVKSRRMRWAGHVARIGRGEVCTGFWWGNLRERDYWGDPDVDGSIILRWTWRKWEGWCSWMELAHDREGWWALVSAVINFRCSIECGEFLYQLQNQLASQESICSMV